MTASGAPGFGRSGYKAPPRARGRGLYLRRFYLKPDNSACLTILDGDGHDKDGNPIPTGGPFGVWEYEVWHNNRPHYFTSPLNIAEGLLGKKDPFKAAFPKELKWSAYVTAIDETLQKWEDDEGKEKTAQYQRVLIPITGKQLPAFKIYDKNQRGLAGTRWETTRTSKEAFRIGDVWSFVEKFDEFNRDKIMTVVGYYQDKIKEEHLPKVKSEEGSEGGEDKEQRLSLVEYLQPLDYEAIFQPPTAGECCELLEKFEKDVPDWLAEEAAKEAGVDPETAAQTGDEDPTDDIPFRRPAAS